MNEKLLKKVEGKELKLFVYATIAVLFCAAFLLGTPREIFDGMMAIFFLREPLMTDYFVLAGYGAAFFNAALILVYVTFLVQKVNLPFTGMTMAVMFINVCYGFWGKNLITMIPILLGSFLYSRLNRTLWNRSIYIGLFGVCLGPILTEMMYALPFSFPVKLILTILLGVLIGLILTPLSAHTASMHMGYNLFNVGFSAGILAFVIVCVMRSFGMEPQGVLVWMEGVHPGIAAGAYAYFGLTFLYGLWLNGWNIKGFWKITRHPGRAVTDFVLMDGPGATLMNMSAVGMLGETYILLIGGDLSGPAQGAVLMAFGFAAFGAHLKNFTPVLCGVFLSTFFTQYAADTPGIQVAALFAVGLSPIAGQFGPLAGIAAGMLHAAVVMCTSSLYGGLNLYNNGFAAGWVAIILIPLIESFMHQFKTRRKTKGK